MLLFHEYVISWNGSAVYRLTLRSTTPVSSCLVLLYPFSMLRHESDTSLYCIQLFSPTQYSFSSLSQTLSLRGCGLKQLPGSIAKLTRLRHLDASENQLQGMQSVSFPTSLRELLLESNRLETVPDAIYRCQELERIVLKQNSLNPVEEASITLRFPKLHELDFHPQEGAA
mmetsp:Transcript_22293/g.62156  ORF Transcript_22293/g.62156 Transcript_22293/m.62156 type:complete len:171 (-) Transcript_22293:835-1347(-)